jgi:hypothetical protein
LGLAGLKAVRGEHFLGRVRGHAGKAGFAAGEMHPRGSSSRIEALTVTGSDTTDQCSTLASILSASAVKTCVPSGRSLGEIVTGTSYSGAKFCRT